MPRSHLDALTETLAKLERTTVVLDRYAQDMERTHVPVQVAQTVARQCLDELRGTIRGMVLANYAASGIHDRTNKLRNAVSSCVVGGTFTPGRPWKLWVMLPKNVSPYTYTPHPKPGHKPGKARSSSFYQVAMTLTYGGVIPTERGTVNTLNKGSRAKLKNKLLSENKTSAKRGGVAYRVIQPHHVFWLSPGQKAEVVSSFVQKYTQKMRSLLGNR